MAVIITGTKPRKVLLTINEIAIIKESLECQSHSLFTFFNCDVIVKKLNDVLRQK